MDIEKGLIIKKVWLDKIFHEGKIWEMRSTKTKYRGKIALIQSGSGMIFGEAELIECTKHKIPETADFIQYHKVEDLRLIKKWGYAWVLRNVKKYDKPIPYNHPKGAVIWVNL